MKTGPEITLKYIIFCILSPSNSIRLRQLKTCSPAFPLRTISIIFPPWVLDTCYNCSFTITTFLIEALHTFSISAFCTHPGHQRHWKHRRHHWRQPAEGMELWGCCLLMDTLNADMRAHCIFVCEHVHCCYDRAQYSRWKVTPIVVLMGQLLYRYKRKWPSLFAVQCNLENRFRSMTAYCIELQGFLCQSFLLIVHQTYSVFPTFSFVSCNTSQSLFPRHKAQTSQCELSGRVFGSGPQSRW